MRGLTNSRSGGGSNLNLLDNWDFTNPVNQRGQSAYTGIGTYAIDRWKFPDRIGTLTVNSGGIGISFKSPETFTSIGQCFENLEGLIGKTVTASILLSDGTIKSVTFKNLTSTSDISGADFNGGYLNLIMTYNCFRIMITKNSSITIKAVKLELGKVSTLKNDLLGVSYAGELRKCQRYYQRFNNTLNTQHNTLGIAEIHTNNKAYLPLNLVVPMRKKPVILFNNVAVQTCKDNVVCGVTSILNYDDYIKEAGIMKVELSSDTGFNSTENSVGLVNFSTGGYIELSADL